MMAVARRRVLVAASLLFLLAACSGEGSDIGPRLPLIPDVSSKVVVLDDQNRGVVSATASVVGTPITALTGRNGRGDFLAAPRGRLLIRADGRNAAAVAADRLAVLQVAMTVDGLDLPSPIHLPDLPDSASAQLTAGAQASTTVITSTAGSIVTITSGVTVSTPAQGATVDLRIGELSPQHLPGDLPGSTLGARLYGRGIFVHPADASFTPGLDLDVADDLMLGTAQAQLYRLNPDTGEWGEVASGFAAGGRIALTNALAAGGLYAFGVATVATTMTGRVLDTDNDPVVGVMVRADHRVAATDSEGRFSVGFVPATMGDGSSRSAQVERFAGGFWLPVVATTTVPVSAGLVDAGDLVLDTVPVGNVRVQQVVRARPDPFGAARLSSLEGDVALFVTGDAAGQAFFEDVPVGFFGFQEGRRRDRTELFYGQSVGFLEPGRRWLDSYQFLLGRPWFLGTRSARAYACDSIGGGPLRNVIIVEGALPGVGSVGETRENGILFADRGFRQRATATVRTQRDGRSITSGFSIDLPSSDHLELPLRRVLRQPLGAFERHGLLAGMLTGVAAGREHGLRVTRRLTRQEWWDDIVDGLPVPTSLPIDIDPATTHGPFRVGMSAVGGNLAAIEFTTPGGANTLQKVGLLRGFQPTEGGLVSVDVPLEFLASETFTVAGAASNVDPDVDLNTLAVALGLESPGGQLVDVARDVRGSYALTTNDLQFVLPPLTGSLLDQRWLALVSGETSSAGVTSSHASLVRLANTTTTGFAFPQFPTLSAPAANTTVVASGFTVAFALPLGALGGMIELRSDAGGDLLLWQVLVRPEQTNFSFVTLPAESAAPLVAGRTYTLTVTAWFGEIDIESPNQFGDVVAFWQSVGLIEAGITQISRRSIQITTM